MITTSMDSAASVRVAQSTLLEIVDIRRPFLETHYVSENYGQNPVLTSIFAHARERGARTLVVEHLKASLDVSIENSRLCSRFPQHRMHALLRLSFWKDVIEVRESLRNQRPETLLGYTILKSDILEQGQSILWHVYEAILAPPIHQAAFIQGMIAETVRIDALDFKVEGILFCGQAHPIKTCAFTNLRSFISSILRRDVQYREIYKITDAAGIDPEIGMTASEIAEVLSKFNIPNAVYDFHSCLDLREQPPVSKILLDSIFAGGGSLVLFEVKEASGHLLFAYGARLNLQSTQHQIESAYSHRSWDPPGFRSTSLEPWIDGIICTDDNFGPYCQLSQTLFPFQRPHVVITASRTKDGLRATDADAIATHVMHAIIQQLPDGPPSNPLLRSVVTGIPRGQLVTRSFLTPLVDYLSYIQNVRDWENNSEEHYSVKQVQSLLGGGSEDVWVVEYTTAELMRSFLKVGEILFCGDFGTSAGDRDSLGLLFARVPGTWWVPSADSGFTIIQSHLQSATPFLNSPTSSSIMMNSNYEYDVALSFAGEDRPCAKALAYELISNNVRVFYDEHAKAELWGKDLYQHLQSVYRDKARYSVVFVSQSYEKKLWTRHELKQMQARAFSENEEYILPIRLDTTALPGVNPTVGYIEWSDYTPGAIADLVLQKLRY